MKQRGSIILGVLFSLVLASTVPVFAHDKLSLRGLNGFLIVFPNCCDTTQKVMGLSKLELQKEIELQFRIANVPMLSPKELAHLPLGKPWAYFEVRIRGGEMEGSDRPLTQEKRFVYTIEIQANRIVFLSDDKKFNQTITATTWEEEQFFFSNRQGIRDNMRNLVNLFLNDFLEMNPKNSESGTSIFK